MKTQILKTSFFPIQIILMSLVFLSNSVAQSVDTTNIESKPGASGLQIGFINETALYYHFPINSSMSFRIGLDFNWNYDDKKDGEGYYRYLNYNYLPNEEKFKSNSTYPEKFISKS